MDYLVDILRARVYDVAVETPLERAPLLSRATGHEIYLKREDLQPIRSFKLRGAYNMMVNLGDDARARGVICASAGNHAQGVALAANKLNCRAVIVIPKTAPPVKVEAVRAMGGPVQLILHGQTLAEALEHAHVLEEVQGLNFVHPYDNHMVIAGQGTIGMEVLRQRPQPIHAIFVAIGGGGMIAGIAAYVKQVRPEIRIIGVQTVDSNSMELSLASGKPTAFDDVGMFADGTAVRCVGVETLRLAKLYVDEIIKVTTDQICAAIKDVFSDTRSILEPSGAMSIAGAKLYSSSHPELAPSSNLVCIACGANLNFNRLKFIVDRAEIGGENLMLMAIRITAETTVVDLINSLPHENRWIQELTCSGDRILLGVKINQGEEGDVVLAAVKTCPGVEAVDITHDECSKLHLRYLIGGGTASTETIVRFEFPERRMWLNTLLQQVIAEGFPIETIHYEDSGGDVARALIGIAGPESAFRVLCDQLQGPFLINFEVDNAAHKLFRK